MKLFTRFRSLFYMLILSILTLTLSGCGGGPAQEATQGDLINGGEPHRLLGFVYDTGGQPVAFADVGGEDYTSEGGVATGNFLDYQGSWIPVRALGYASGYARAHGEEQGSPFFETRLTAYQDLVYLLEGESAVLSGYQGDVSWSAEVSAGQFSTAPLMVGLAALDPDYVEPRIVLYGDGPDLRLRGALALEAFTSEDPEISLRDGESIALTLTLPGPLSASAAFARFDLASGEWQTLDLGCSPAGENQYTCQLEALDPLIGLFDLPETFAAQAGSGAGAALSPVYADDEGAFNSAWNALVDWLLDQQASSGGVDPDDPTLKNLIENLANAAKNYAKNNPTEGGKAKLGKAAQAATANGQSAAAQSLLDQMGEISDELGNKALKESDCGEFEKLLKAAEQIMRTSQNKSLSDQLIKKAGEMTKDCDVWDGSITVWMRAGSSHPSGLPMQGKGGGLWTEIHKVKIWTNVDDHVMHGESKISLSFPSAVYVKEKPCREEITMSGGGASEASFEGLFDGLAFQVNSTQPSGKGGSIQQSWRFKTKNEDGECEMSYSQDFSMSPYHSILLHGLSSDSPPLNYQEILDSAANYATDKGITRFGGDQSFGNPDPELGIYPYETITVSWSFFHTQHKLPIEENK